MKDALPSARPHSQPRNPSRPHDRVMVLSSGCRARSRATHVPPRRQLLAVLLCGLCALAGRYAGLALGYPLLGVLLGGFAGGCVVARFVWRK